MNESSKSNLFMNENLSQFLITFIQGVLIIVERLKSYWKKYCFSSSGSDLIS